MGGIVRAIELGFPQKEIADAAYRYQQQLDRGEKVVVGVNKLPGRPRSAPLEILRVDAEVERAAGRRACARVKQARNAGDGARRASPRCARRAESGDEPHAADRSPR